MLENEPENDQQPPVTNQSAPAASRRRRAASRPAGPPSSAAVVPPAEHVPAAAQLDLPPADALPVADPQAEVPAPVPVQPEVAAAPESPQLELPAPPADDVVQPPVKKGPAKRPARKTAKKAVAASPEQPEPVADEATVVDEAVQPPKKRASRARAPKKAVEPQQDSAPAVAVPVDARSEEELAQADAASPAGWAAPDQNEPEAAALDPVEEPAEESIDDQGESATAVAATEAPRDFGWLADPFAVSASRQLTVPDEPADATDDDDTDTDESASEDSAAEVPDSDSDDSEDDESGDGSNRRRRRRRGGRRRRRSGGDDQAADGDSDQADAAVDVSDPSHTEDEPKAAGADRAGDEPTEEADSEDADGQTRRRRRRRRRGEETAALPDDPSDVVVRVREPRTRRKVASDEVTGIQGSTRMEAKRQRRKEGRDAGRRRAPILSEAEFLARRESVLRQMIIRQRADLAQIAVLEDGILVEHYVDRDSAASLIGNVYLGRVQNVLPSMEAAFIDIGRGRNAVLYAGEVDWDSFGAEGHNRKVEKVLKSGQMILVQVSKDPVGAKGARLTNHVSIPGRYVVYAPGGHLSGISRKLPDVERRRLKDILADLVGSSASVIVRTAAEGASEEELVRDVNRLKAQWEDIERKVKAGNSPQLLYGEPDLTVRIVRDLFTEDFSELIIQGNGSMNDAYDAIQGYVTHVAPHLQERIRRWEPTGTADLFAEYRLDEQIVKALERKVFLPSGGSLVIDRTEAMTVIDVNTGKFTGTGGNLEATVTSNNLEAAEEIVNQLRVRDIGGIIVIDFIDMVLPSNRELLLRRLVECLGRDRTRHQVAEVTSLGLIQMTRKKIGTGLLEAFATECPTCSGRGYELHELPVDTQKQADGGTRDVRQQNHRPRPSDLARADQGPAVPAPPNRDASRGNGSGRPAGGGRNGVSAPSEPARDAQPLLQPEPASDGVPGSDDGQGDGGDQPERGRSRRSRRGGRGVAVRERLDEEQQDDQQQDDVQQSNRAFYDDRERDNREQENREQENREHENREQENRERDNRELDNLELTGSHAAPAQPEQVEPAQAEHEQVEAEPAQVEPEQVEPAQAEPELQQVEPELQQVEPELQQVEPEHNQAVSDDHEGDAPQVNDGEPEPQPSSVA